MCVPELCLVVPVFELFKLTEQAFASQNRRPEDTDANQISATEVFHVPFFCVNENSAFAKHPDIIACHQLNGAETSS